ncbi:hypothetical protein ACFZDK_53955 [Streptomyces sp. NPDC007901]|uniref:hypothetical protein n=1 Tax=Streptomyces sp. NPDC007901 TaxID=3364785 RepID=UPI0036E2C24D
MPQADTPLDTADLSTLADRQQAWFTTGHGPVFVRRYARSSDFVRAAVHSANGQDRAALLTLHPDAYPLAPAWLAAIAEAAPHTADHRHPSAAMSSVRLLARMTPDHRNGIPRQTDGSADWSMPGATARIWPDGRIELRGTTGTELTGRLEGSEWDHWKVAAAADAGLRLLCAPEALHLTSTGEPSGWHRPLTGRWTGAGPGRAGSARAVRCTTPPRWPAAPAAGA